MSCEKEPGEGGTSSITGKVLVLEGYNNVFTQSFDTTAFYPADEEEIYIIYSGDSSKVYDDSFDTSWDGAYHFQFLRKGNYTLFAYSDCDTCESGKKPLFWRVNISENNKTYYIEDKVIRN